jgi:hypothetical protein
MTGPSPNPTRLSRLPETEDVLGVGAMFRSARELPNEELPRLRWRLRTSRRLHDVVRPRLLLRSALVLGFVFLLGGVVGAVVAPWRARPKPAAVTSLDPTPAPAPRRSRARSAVPAPSAEPAAPTPPTSGLGAPPTEPEPAVQPAQQRKPVRVAMVREPPPQAPPDPAPGLPPPAPAPTPPAPSSPIALEQALLTQAVKTLHEARDARAALALLSRYEERFPSGVLTPEATMLRIEALLGLARGDEALSLLDQVPLASLPNRDELRVVRGELRARAGRWREAKRDFDDVLRGRAAPAAGTKARDLQERALWGRAAARSRMGDADGAQADLNLYLRHFPEGRFASPAAALVKAKP